MKRFKLIVGVLILFGLMFSACGGPKKCGGGKGTKVEMGTM